MGSVTNQLASIRLKYSTNSILIDIKTSNPLQWIQTLAPATSKTIFLLPIRTPSTFSRSFRATRLRLTSRFVEATYRSRCSRKWVCSTWYRPNTCSIRTTPTPKHNRPVFNNTLKRCLINSSRRTIYPYSTNKRFSNTNSNFYCSNSNSSRPKLPPRKRWCSLPHRSCKAE